jgi:hypothetical protein
LLLLRFAIWWAIGHCLIDNDYWLDAAIEYLRWFHAASADAWRMLVSQNFHRQFPTDNFKFQCPIIDDIYTTHFKCLFWFLWVSHIYFHYCYYAWAIRTIAPQRTPYRTARASVNFAT